MTLSLGLLLTGCQENIAAEIVENATLFPAPEAGEGVLGGLTEPHQLEAEGKAGGESGLCFGNGFQSIFVDEGVQKLFFLFVQKRVKLFVAGKGAFLAGTVFL